MTRYITCDYCDEYTKLDGSETLTYDGDKYVGHAECMRELGEQKLTEVVTLRETIREWLYAHEAYAREENDGEVDYDLLCASVTEKFGVICDYAYIDGFDSPGYSVDYYVFAFVADGHIAFATFENECY